MNAQLLSPVVNSLPIPLGEAELMAYLDKVEVRRAGHLARIAPDVLRDVIERRLIDARFSYGVYPVCQIGSGTVRLKNDVEFIAPLVAHRMKRSTYLAFATVTVGHGLSQRAKSLNREGSVVRAMIAQSIAGYAIETVVGALVAALDEDAAARGLSCSGYINPGDFGFDLVNQATILKLAHAALIGVTCSECCVMAPVHSVSAVFGFGRSMRKWTQIENCEACPSKDRCVHMKASVRAAASVVT